MKISRVLFLVILFLTMFSATLVFSSDDINLNKIEKSFWDNGNIRIVRYYSLSGGLKETSFYDKNGSLEKLINYDKLGKRIAESHYLPDGSLKATVNGWAAVRWEYRGRKLYRESYFDKEGQIIECKEYDISGNLLEDSSCEIKGVEYAENIGKPSLSAGRETLSY